LLAKVWCSVSQNEFETLLSDQNSNSVASELYQYSDSNDDKQSTLYKTVDLKVKVIECIHFKTFFTF